MDKINGISENITVIQSWWIIKDYAVGIYVRVSTNHKDQIDNLAIQASRLIRLAAAHRTVFVVDIFLLMLDLKNRIIQTGV